MGGPASSPTHGSKVPTAKSIRTQNAAGMQRLFKQFSFPGGIPSHTAPETPGSIHEGGELGYALSHAHGAAFDNPNLIVACVVGDGEAESGPMATSCLTRPLGATVGDLLDKPVSHGGLNLSRPLASAVIAVFIGRNRRLGARAKYP